MPRIGFTLQPEERYLELLGAVIREEADYFEVAPETLWSVDGEGRFVPNGFHRAFQALRDETRKTFVAHGVGFSVGSASPDAARRSRWLERIRADHEAFEFAWYTDHLGATVIGGQDLILPLPLAMTDASATIVREGLHALQQVVDDVGVENSVFYFHLGDPLDEPAFLGRILSAPRTHLLLDLHNVYTVALNAGFDPWRYVAELPLERVIEIHLSGGEPSDPAWLPSRRVLRLDSHDHAVPEEVWELFERTLPACPNVRGVTVERMEGTVGEEDVEVLREELRRARRIVEGRRV